MKYYGALNYYTFSRIEPDHLAHYIKDLDGIEIMLFDDEYVEYLRTLETLYNGEYGFHATSTNIKELKEYWVPLYKSFSRFTGLITIHPLETMKETMNLLQELNKIEGVFFCVENLDTLHGISNMNKEILDNSELFHITYDISHLLYDYPTLSIVEINKYLTKKVELVHIHGISETKDHLPLNDHYNYSKILKGYNNKVVFEMHIGKYQGDIYVQLWKYLQQIREFILNKQLYELRY